MVSAFPRPVPSLAEGTRAEKSKVILTAICTAVAVIRSLPVQPYRVLLATSVMHKEQRHPGQPGPERRKIAK